MQFSDSTTKLDFIQIYIENDWQMYYCTTNKQFYKSINRNNKNSNVKVYIAIMFAVYVCYAGNPYWLMMLWKYSFLKIVLTAIGIVGIPFSYWISIKKINQLLNTYGQAGMEQMVMNEKVNKGRKHLQTQCFIMIGWLLFIVCLLTAFILTSHIAAALCFIVSTVIMGVMAAAIRPIKRKRFYQTWEKTGGIKWTY